MSDNLLNLARVSEEKPQAAPSTEYQDMRSTKYGDQYCVNLYNGMQGLSAEGSMFVTTSATPGTGATSTAATGTTYSATQALLVLYNSDTQPSYGAGRRVFLDTITLICTAAGTASTICHVAHQVDVGNRYASGTNLLGTPVNLNMDASGVGSVCRPYGGVITASAASTAMRFVGRNVLKVAAAPAWVAGDMVTIKFGAQDCGGYGNISGTAAAAFTVYAPPIVIGPNQSYILNEWSTSRTAAQSFEFIVTYFER
jgi:hypothetical protein